MLRDEALEELRKPDAILESPDKIAKAIEVLSTSKDGNGENSSDSENVAAILTESYQGAIEFLFEIGTWLTYIDDNPQQTRDIIESVVMEIILQNYDRMKTLKFFDSGNAYEAVKWQSLLIQSARWRQTIYELAQQPRNEDCVFLSLAMPLIADNFIDELVSVPMAWGTLEIYLSCVNYTLRPLLDNFPQIMDDDLFFLSMAFMKVPSTNSSSSQQQSQPSTQHGFQETALGRYIIEMQADPEKKKIYEHLNHFLDMGCHSEATYLMLQSVLQCLIRRRNDNAARHLSLLLESEACRRGCDVSRYSVYFCYAKNYPTEVMAMRNILAEQTLTNPQLETVYTAYMGDVPPPVSLIRQPLFIVMLADVLFANPERLLNEQLECYAYLYAYSSVTIEEIDLSTERRLELDRSDVAKVSSDIMEASRICKHWNMSTGSAVSLRAFRDLPTLLQLLRHRSIAFGAFRFLWAIFRSKRVEFELNLETMKPYCIVVNELASLNPYLRPAILFFVSELLGSRMEGMEDLSQLEYKKMLVGLLVHLITCGYVLPTIRKMHLLFQRNHVDVSIVRHFVTELLGIASPPYHPEFMKAMYPLVSHPDITDGLQTQLHTDLVKDFMAHFENEIGSDEMS
nr:negative elongation factor D [Hymenolepis microstoma]